MAVEAHSKTVKLYYLGGLTPAGVETAPVTASNGSYMLPKPGDYITVPVYAAKDLMRKHKIVDRQGNVFEAFTTDPRFAREYMNGNRGVKAVTVTDTSQLSDDALLAELERRKLLGGEDAPVPETPSLEGDFLEPQLEAKPKGKK